MRFNQVSSSSLIVQRHDHRTQAAAARRSRSLSRPKAEKQRSKGYESDSTDEYSIGSDDVKQKVMYKTLPLFYFRNLEMLIYELSFMFDMFGIRIFQVTYFDMQQY